jgi:hypothetical protein
MNPNYVKWFVIGDTVALGALTALDGTGVLSGTGTAVVGGLITVLNAALGWATNRSVKRQLAAAKAGRRA